MQMANSDVVLATCTRLVTPPATACRCAGDPTCCPGEAEIVSEHAPLIMLTATADALLDEGVSYASKLEEAGGWPNKFATEHIQSDMRCRDHCNSYAPQIMSLSCAQEQMLRGSPGAAVTSAQLSMIEKPSG
jgi:hypothetical protein